MMRAKPIKLSAEEFDLLPAIADRLEAGKSLTADQRRIAAAAIRDRFRLRVTNTGRPRRWSSLQEKWKYYNDRRRHGG